MGFGAPCYEIVDYVSYGKQRARIINAYTNRQLDLGGLLLTAVPLEALHIPGLKSMVLENNRIAMIPKEIGNLRELETLNLSRNELTTLPPELALCQKLEKLFLNKNFISALPSEIGSLKSLRKFTITENPIKEIPWEMGRMDPKVLELFLLTCKTVKEPPSIVTRRAFEMSSAELAKVGLSNPDPSVTIRYLKELDMGNSTKELRLAHWHIEAFPITLSKMTDLKLVDVSNNHITKFPSQAVRSLTNVTWLDISNNAIEVLPEEVRYLTKLEVLKTFGNPIRVFPLTLGYSENLREIDADYSIVQVPGPEICQQGQARVIEFLHALVDGSKSSRLRLNGYRLQQIPVVIFDMYSLKVMDVSQNHLQSLGELPLPSTLKTVNISQNVMKKIPDSLWFLQNIRKLYISNNRFEVLSEGIGHLCRLKELIAHNNEFKKIPKEVGNMLKLETLDLSHNSIQDIHENMGQCVWLTNLDLSRNHLGSLPSTFRRLTTLRKLSIAHNQFSHIPDSIWHYKLLEYFGCHGNKITIIDDNIQYLAHLTELDATENPITILSPMIAKCSMLKLISIDSKNLMVPAPEIQKMGVPATIGYTRTLMQCEDIGILDLSGVGFENIPIEIKWLSRLTQLCLDDNHIPRLTDTLCHNCTNLTILTLNNNKMVELHEDLYFLIKLQRFEFRNNYVARLPCGLGVMTSLTSLSCINNDMRSPPEEIQVRGLPMIMSWCQRIQGAKSSGSLDFTKFGLVTLPGESIEHDLPDLRELDISFNSVQSLPIEIKNLTKLTVLKVENNSLVSLPDFLGKCRFLRIISLNDNNLTEIPECIFSIRKLAELYLKHNAIKYFSDGITNLRNLRVLNLQHNKCKDLPAYMGALVRLKHLDLAFNLMPSPLPPFFGNLTDMEELSLKNTPILHLCPQMCRLTKLRKLTVNDRMLFPPFSIIEKGGAVEAVRYLNQFEKSKHDLHLDLADFILLQMPPEVTTMTNLESLTLRRNPFGVVPPLAGDSANPKALKISDPLYAMDVYGEDVLKYFVPDIGRLSALTSLIISETNIMYMPESLGNLVLLKTLDLSQNKLVELPPVFSSLINLEYLFLQKNDMHWLPVSLGFLKNLKMLQADFSSKIIAPPKEVTNMGLETIKKWMMSIIENGDKGIAILENYGMKLFPIELTEPRVASISNLLTKVSVANNRIKIIPETISRLTRLSVFNCSGNRISSLPTTLCMLDQIRHIIADSNCLESLPAKIGGLSKLTELSVCSNRLRDFPVSVRYLSNLTSVRADGNQMHYLPSTLSGIPNLVSLSAAKNDMIQIPGAFALQSSLRMLDLSFNAFTEIPMITTALLHLSVLKFHGNRIETLPSDFAQLLALQEFTFDIDALQDPPIYIANRGQHFLLDYMNRLLDGLTFSTLELSKMKLGSIPEATLCIPGLKNAIFHDNNLSLLPLDLHTMPLSLLLLDLSLNCITEIPSAFGNLTNLQTLKLDDNRLTAFPDHLVNLTALVTLSAMRNRIQLLPPKFEKRLTNIQVLLLDDNELTQLPDELGGEDSVLDSIMPAWKETPIPVGGLKNLRILHLSSNHLRFLPGSIRGLVNIEELHASDNRFHTLPNKLKRLSKLKSLKLSIRHITELQDLNLGSVVDSGLHPPMELMLQGPEYVTKFVGRTSEANRIFSLDLASLKLTRVPRELRFVTRLEYLDISNNRIVDLTQEISWFPELAYLDASDNYLEWVTPTIRLCTSLTALKLHNNYLRSIPPAIVKLSRLVKFRYHNQNRDLTYRKAKNVSESIAGIRNSIVNWWEGVNATLLDPPPEIVSRGLRTMMMWLRKEWKLRTRGIFDAVNMRLHVMPLPLLELNQDFFCIQQLNMSCNRITMVPDEIRLLSQLQVLNVSKNRLHQLPESMRYLKTLETLDISDNPLTVLPFQSLLNIAKKHSFKTLIAENTFLGILPPIGTVTTSAHEAIRFLHSISTGRFTGTLNLAGFELSQMPADLLAWPGQQLWDETTSGAGVAVGSEERFDMVELRSVDLSQNLLFDISAELMRFPQLTRLNLSHNRVAELPASIAFATSVTWLSLDYNKLEKLPRGVKNLTRLAYLSISNNILRRLPRSIGGMTGLLEAHFENNRLKRIPERMRTCSSLRKLTFCKNQMDSLPGPLFDQMTLLRELDLSDNRLRTLPSSIGSLRSVRFLNVRGNRILVLPASISLLPSIQVIIMSANNIGIMPKAVCRILPVVKLDLSQNGMVKMIPHIDHLTNLKDLSFDSNNMELMPDSLGNITGLQRLSLNVNRLKELPPSIARLQNLTELCVSNNRLFDVPEELCSCTSLKKLFLDQNLIKALPNKFDQLVNLEELYLDQNSLKELPDSLTKITTLKHLGINWNKWHEFPEDVVSRIPSLTSLDVDVMTAVPIPRAMSTLVSLSKVRYELTDFKIVPHRVCEDGIEKILKFLELQSIARFTNDLNLSNLRLAEIPWVVATSLRTLELEHNDIKNPVFFWIKDLVDLRVSHNAIRNLSPSIAVLSCLKSLNLSNNKMVSLPASLARLSNLTSLAIQKNRLTSLPYEIGDMPKLKAIYADDNRLSELHPRFSGLVPTLGTFTLDRNRFSKSMVDIIGKGVAFLLDFITRTKVAWQQQDFLLEDMHLIHMPSDVPYAMSATRLVANRNNIRSIPDSLRLMMTQLVHLEMRNNVVSTIWEGYRFQETLLYLDLSYNRLDIISEAILQAWHLTHLLLEHNFIDEIPEGITNLENLKVFMLADNKLNSIPDYICELQSLEHIEFEGNNIQKVPASLLSCPNLRTLNASGNFKSTRPIPSHDFRHFSCLTNLILDENNITVVPDLMQFLSNLKCLSLAENRILALPPTFSALVHLTSVDLSANRISAFPPITSIRSITKLSLAFNQICVIPMEVGNFEKMLQFIMNNNLLTEFPATVRTMTALEELILYRNKLVTLPAEICNLTRLRDILLHSNSVTELPTTMSALTNLEHLTLRENELSKPPSFILQLTKLKTLSLGKNRFAYNEVEDGVADMDNRKLMK